MKTIICCINSKYIHSSLAPWCLLAGVKAYCDNNYSSFTKVIEGTINEDENKIIKRLVDEKPDVIGFCTYIWNVDTVKYIITKIKSDYPNIKIILGGPEVSYNAAELLYENGNIDYIVSGEGEKPFAMLLNAIFNNTAPPQNYGICYKKQNSIFLSEPYVSDDEPVSPYCDEYFNSLKGRIAYIETSRGCPYSCAFCLSGRCGKARFFNIENAKQNILKLANSGTKTIKFVDRTFNANKKRAKEIISFIIENYASSIPKGVCFHFEIAGDILDRETIDLLSCAPKGSIQLEIGLQSFNENTLSYINRKTNTAKLKSNIKKLIAQRNIHIHIDLIAGLPLEDINSFRDSFNIAFSLCPDMLQLGFLKLLFGAPMRENKEEFPCVYSGKPPYEVISTPWLSENDVEVLKRIEDALERLYNSHRFTRTLDYVFFTLSETPFDFFYSFSDFIKEENLDGISLDGYTKLLFSFLSEKSRIDKEILRDKIVCDRLSSIKAGVLPDYLKIQDSNYKKIRNALNELVGMCKNGRRGMAVLYSENAVVYTDYESKDVVTGEYRLNYVSFDTLDK